MDDSTDADIQAPSQDIFIHCSLLSSDKQTFMDYVMRRRSTCRRRIRNVVVTVTVTVKQYSNFIFVTTCRLEEISGKTSYIVDENGSK